MSNRPPFVSLTRARAAATLVRRSMRRGLWALVLAGSGCVGSHAVRHMSAASATPGLVGYGVTSFVHESGLIRSETVRTSSAAMVPPEPAEQIRDVTWTAGEHGEGLMFCRPLAAGGHQCQPVPLSGGQVTVLDPVNRGSFFSRISGGNQVIARGAVTTGVSSHLPLTPHYGVWVSSPALHHCRLVANRPECNPVLIPPVEGVVFALPLVHSVSVIRAEDAPRDVVWLQVAQAMVRCEAGGVGLPSCRVAQFR